MRWERLFDDLEAQAAEAEQASLGPEVADRTRRELARVRLADRLRAAVGCRVTIVVAGVGQVTGTVQAAGPDWLLVSERAGSETVIRTAAVVSVGGLGAHAAVAGAEGEVGARLGLAYVLRGIARDRSEVVMSLTDESTLTGRVDRVGADFVDVAMRAETEKRRAEEPGTRTVPWSAVAALRRAV
jgi:hypothetical protein